MSSTQNYKKNLQKWADRCGATVKISSEQSDVYVLGVKTGTEWHSSVICSLLGGELKVKREAEETLENCEQRSAQQFLNIYAKSPLGRI